MKWPICWSRPGNRGITYTLQPPDTHTHPAADTHLTPSLFTLSRCHSASIQPFSFLFFPLGFPFICFPSPLSQAFYCVTHTDSTLPHLFCAFAAAHRKGCCLCLANLPPDAPNKMSVCTVIRLHRQSSNLSFHNTSCPRDGTIFLLPSPPFFFCSSSHVCPALLQEGFSLQLYLKHLSVSTCLAEDPLAEKTNNHMNKT